MNFLQAQFGSGGRQPQQQQQQIPVPTKEVDLAAVSVQMLTPFYGPDRSKHIMSYLSEFMPYTTNFQPIVGSIREQHVAGLAGQVLLGLVCPLLVQCRDSTKSIVVVNVLFPMHFPDQAPFATLTLPNNARVKDGHPTVMQNGVIRLVLLPLLQNGPKPPYTLVEVLLAITEACEEVFPFVHAAAPTSVSQLEPTVPPSSATASNAIATPQTASTIPTTAVNTAVGLPPVAAPPVHPAPTSAAPIVRPEVSRAAEALMMHLAAATERYLVTRDDGLEMLRSLQQDAAHLDAARKQVHSDLETTTAVLNEAQKLRDALSGSDDMVMPTHTGDVLAPSDEKSAAACSLLAHYHSLDDMMQLEEVLLKKRLLSVESFTKNISDIARSQFLSRYKYNVLLMGPGGGGRAAATSTAPTASGSPAVSMPPQAAASATSTTIPSASTSGSTPVAAPGETPIEALLRQFPDADRGLIVDVWEATKSLATATQELRALLAC